MDSQTFNLPTEMKSVLSAAIIDTVNGDILFCHDQSFLYAAKIAKIGGSVIFQRFNLPSLVKLIPIIRNYFIAVFASSKLTIFEVWFNEQNKVNLKYIFCKNDKTCTSYFLREVVQNMAELHLLYPQHELYVYQFTVNGKVGHMNYVIGNQNKIIAERQQLYGSKTIVCPQGKIFYYFNNFSSKCANTINLAKLQTELSEHWKTTPLAYISLPKTEESYLILANMIVINITNPALKHQIQIDEEYQEQITKLMQRKSKPSFTISTYFDMVLIQDLQLMIAVVFHIKQKGSTLIAVEYGNFNWFWTSTRKLVGFSPNRHSFKMIDHLKMSPRMNLNSQENALTQEDKQMQLKQQKIKSMSSLKQENITDFNKQKQQVFQKSLTLANPDIMHQQTKKQGSLQKLIEKTVSKSIQEKLKKIFKPQIPQESPLQKFVPMKVIGKKGVNISKSINKPKQIQPISKEEGEIPSNKAVQKANENESSPIQQFTCGGLNFLEMKQKQIKEQKKEENSQNELMIREEQQIIEMIEQKLPEKLQTNTLTNQQQSITLKTKIAEPNKQQQLNNIQLLEITKQKQQQSKSQQQNCNNNDSIKQPQKNILQENLSKSLALMIQKRNLGGLEPSVTSINRNKIFNNPFLNSLIPTTSQQDAKQKLEGTKQEYYNPLLSPSPLDILKKDTEQVFPCKESPNMQTIPQEEKVQEQNNHQQTVNILKELFQNTTTKLLKVLQEMNQAGNIEPYLKEKIRSQIERKIMQTLKKELTGSFGAKIELFFRQIFRQTSAIQEQSLRFYKEAAIHKSSNIEVQLNNQQKMLKEIKQIENMIRFTISSLRNENRETYEILIRHWSSELKEASQIVSNLNSFKTKLEEEAEQRNKRYDDTKKQLENIKNILLERANQEQLRKQKQLEAKSLKLKQQQQKEKAKQKKPHRKIPDEREKRTKLRKGGEL